VAHDVASCEPQDEQSDEEMNETAAAAATARAPGRVGFRVRVGGRGRCRLQVGVHLIVGVGHGGEERLSRRHEDQKGAAGKKSG